MTCDVAFHDTSLKSIRAQVRQAQKIVQDKLLPLVRDKHRPTRLWPHHPSPAPPKNIIQFFKYCTVATLESCEHA